MRTLKLLTFTIALTCVSLVCWAGKESDRQKLAVDVTSAIEMFKKADPGLEELFKSAEGYAVFPNVGKGGFIVGGAHGNGQVFEKGKLVGYASLSKITVGAQIGGQELSEIIFFENKSTLEKFKESGFAMSAEVSAVAAAEGASKNAKYIDGVMVFTRAKQGLMAEASVGGQKFKFEPIVK